MSKMNWFAYPKRHILRADVVSRIKSLGQMNGFKTMELVDAYS
jgi:hypothetical protein